MTVGHMQHIALPGLAHILEVFQTLSDEIELMPQWLAELYT